VGKKAQSTSITPDGERVSLAVALQRRLERCLASGAKRVKLGAVIKAMNTAVIEEDSYLYLGETLIDAGWFADNARIKRVNGEITVWPFGGSCPWPFEPPERWSIVDTGAELSTAKVRAALRQTPGPKTARDWQDHVLREMYRAYYDRRAMPTGPELSTSCTEYLGVTADVSDINKFLKAVRDER
jgi:hypothetical protein